MLPQPENALWQRISVLKRLGPPRNLPRCESGTPAEKERRRGPSLNFLGWTQESAVRVGLADVVGHPPYLLTRRPKPLGLSPYPLVSHCGKERQNRLRRSDGRGCCAINGCCFSAAPTLYSGSRSSIKAIRTISVVTVTHKLLHI